MEEFEKDCFETFKSIKDEISNKGSVSIVDAEKQFLFHGQCMKYITNRTGGRGTIEMAKCHFKNISETHSCHTGCNLICLPKTMQFNWQGNEYKATGDVWICPISANIHLCGAACSRTSSVTNGNEEEIYCMLTGASISKIMSTATSHKEDFFVFSGTGELVAPRGFESTMAASRQALSIPHVDKFTELSSDANCDYYIAEYVYQQHGELEWSDKVKLCKDIKEYKATAEAEYDKMAMHEKYEEYQKALEVEARKKFIAEVASYVNTCIAIRAPIDYFTVMSLFYKYEYPVYNNVYLNVNMEKLKTDIKHQVVWQAVDVWIKLRRLAIVKKKNLMFKNCVSGLFYYMSLEKGLFENIVLHPDTKKPFKYEDAVRQKIESSEMFQVTFIPKVSGLILASMNVIKAATEDANNNMNREMGICQNNGKGKKGVKRQRTSKITNSATGRRSSKIINTTQVIIPGQGFSPIVNNVQQKVVKILPSMMDVQQLYNGAVVESATIDELLRYCINPVTVRNTT